MRFFSIALMFAAVSAVKITRGDDEVVDGVTDMAEKVSKLV